MAKRIYYPINKNMAQAANDANSMRVYKTGSATQQYKEQVNSVYDIVDQIAERKPDLLERAEMMAGRYSRKLANYYNVYYRNEAACPSINISGGSNFPVTKKKKQNSRRGTLMEEWVQIEEYASKIENLLTNKQPILSNDERAVEKLELKLEQLRQRQDDMKAANAYYRKNGTLEGCPVLSEKDIRSIEADWARGWYVGTPYPPYLLSNNNKNIHATESRLELLKAAKKTKTTKTEHDGFTEVENTDIMRLQFIFDDKPEPEVRDILKRNGFRWSRANEAWQRQLTENAKRAARTVIKELEAK